MRTQPRSRKTSVEEKGSAMSTWQEQLSDPAGLGVDHGENEGEDVGSPCSGTLTRVGKGSRSAS
jgi:hypothetical protein